MNPQWEQNGRSTTFLDSSLSPRRSSTRIPPHTQVPPLMSVDKEYAFPGESNQAPGEERKRNQNAPAPPSSSPSTESPLWSNNLSQIFATPSFGDTSSIFQSDRLSSWNPEVSHRASLPTGMPTLVNDPLMATRRMITLNKRSFPL